LPSPGSHEAYERANALRDRISGKVYRDDVRPRWIGDGARFWYRNRLQEGKREFILLDADDGEPARGPAFDHARLAAALAAASGTDVDADALPFDEIEWGDEGGSISFAVGDLRWRCDLDDYTVTQADAKEEDEADDSDGELSPDEAWLAVVRDHNLFLRRAATGIEFALTTDGSAADGFSGRMSWSPDSRRLVAVRTVAGEDHQVHLVESSPKDQLQPKLHSSLYRKPGDRIPLSRPCLFDVATRRETPISGAYFPNPWSIGDIRWEADSSRFTFLYNQRGHQILRVLAVDAETGACRIIVEERARTFIDYAYKRFCHFTGDSGEVVWMSERDGWNHLYLYDAATGHVKSRITRGEWVVRSVEHVDDEARQVWFTASGIRAGEDPYYVHLCRVGLDGDGFTVLTDGDGTHSVSFSPDRRFFVDTWSRVDAPPASVLRRSEDGSVAAELERADWDDLRATGWDPPEQFTAKARDGVTDIHGVIWRPSDFDPDASYPVVEHIYAGPHGSFAPKAFQPYHRGQEMAKLGFVVVQMDGMGTSDRSKAFHDVCWRALGDSGFPDRIPWIRAAAESRPYMDLSRVGIYGGSAGGQSTLRALLTHGDFYHVGVADCGCHDNRMDKIWWNELWMGWPIGAHYREHSNATHAARLAGKLLLVVGELDTNVDPASTMQVVDALIKADKDFDLLVVPGGGHGIAEATYGNRRRQDFLVRHLLGVEPRHDAPSDPASDPPADPPGDVSSA
jgi:dipeptidyl aminopeptidase/acylaminoacyl peptidase